MKLKCPECNGCLESKTEDNKIVFYCTFCNKKFGLEPGNKIVELKVIKRKKRSYNRKEI